MPWGSVDLAEESHFIISMFEGDVPARVLDVGVGFGSFALAYRSVQLRRGTLVDKERWFSHQDLMDRANWRGVLDGIDIKDYSKSPAWLFYNTVHVGDALQILASMPAASYDVVVANDIIEHFELDVVGTFVDQLQRVAQSVVVVGYPLTVREVGDEGVEQHRVIADPEIVLRGFTHRVHLHDAWAISFKLLGTLRPGRHAS